MTEEFVEALVEAPVGVVTLAAIEERFGDRRTFIRPEDLVSDPEAVERAVDWVRGASVGEVLALAVEDGGGRAGPWVSGAAGEVAAAYRNAESRLPIAVAVAQRFDDVLHAPMGPAGQEWWTADRSPYRHHDGTLLWTVSSHPVEVHDGVVSARDSARDDLYPPPISRWSIEIESQPRVKEIHRPSELGRSGRALARHRRGHVQDIWHLGVQVAQAAAALPPAQAAGVREDTFRRGRTASSAQSVSFAQSVPVFVASAIRIRPRRAGSRTSGRAGAARGLPGAGAARRRGLGRGGRAL